ncbi:MAG: alpha/beta fold hydrolase [Candidatus Nanoarchaeia archaeon]
MMENVEDLTLRASDNVIIKGSFFPSSSSKKGLILLHQLAKNRDSWKPWIPEFNKTHNVIAIDLRGHGESNGDFKDFSDDDFNSMKKDVAASVEFLVKKGLEPKQISFIGASIGANTVQNYVSVNAHDKAVLLSPGLNYRGIKLTMKDTSSLIVVSTEDSYSCDSVKDLEKISPASKFIYLSNKGHGTNMLDSKLVAEIVRFLNS